MTDYLQDLWDAVQENDKKGGDSGERKFTEVPDGDHVAVLKKVMMFEPDGVKPGSISPTFYYPEHNREEWFYLQLPDQKDSDRDQERVKWLKRFCSGLGIKPQSLGHVMKDASAKVGESFHVTKKTNGKYRNYYVNKPADVKPDTAGANLADDSIPF